MQAARLITVSIPAHPEFLFDALHGSDGLSTLSGYTVRLLHRSMQVDVRSLLGESLTITISAGEFTVSRKEWPYDAKTLLTHKTAVFRRYGH